MVEQSIPLSRPYVGKEEIEAVVSVLKTGRLSIGARLEAFEAACAARAGRKYGIGVNSGTSGLHLCVRALEIREGDEVITTPFTFIATANSILFERATPVFVDIDAETYNLDPSALESAVTSRTKAIMPVEAFGNTAHLDEYEAIARRHGLLMIEDCCEALGGMLGDRPAGNFGECGVFAFYANKQITTGEGGVIVTDDEKVRDLCRSLRNQGRATDAWLEHARLGYNYRLDEMSAALGEVQINRLDEILRKRRAAADMYDDALKGVEGINLPPMAERQNASWFVYVIRLADSFTRQQRDAVVQRLRDAGVGCSSYFVPVHLQPYISEMLGTRKGDFPVTERVAGRTIALPFFTDLAAEQVQRVRSALEQALANPR